jgi:hypothetical protein
MSLIEILYSDRKMLFHSLMNRNFRSGRVGSLRDLTRDRGSEQTEPVTERTHRVLTGDGRPRNGGSGAPRPKTGAAYSCDRDKKIEDQSRESLTPVANKIMSHYLQPRLPVTIPSLFTPIGVKLLLQQVLGRGFYKFLDLTVEKTAMLM